VLEIAVARRIGELDLRIDLALDRETVLVAGPNGAGKSTLLRLVLGVLAPDAGRIALDGQLLFDAEAGLDVSIEDRELAYLPQDYALFPHLDVMRNAMFGLAALPREERLRGATEWLERLGVGRLSRRFPGELSGGERQRVALARALARNPRALLLDEPFASLDPVARRELRVSLRGWLRSWRLSALIVSHDPADAVLADRVAVVEKGRVIQQGTVEELRQSPASTFVSGFAVRSA
jgi:ABC-type sulfate/molybdate transport systems ATPase subunit